MMGEGMNEYCPVIEQIIGKNHCPVIGTHKWNYQTAARSMASPTE